MTDSSPPTRYPLAWPIGWRRFEGTRMRSKYSTYGKRLTTFDGLTRALSELRLLRARGVIVSSNVQVNLKGLPYSNQAEPRDPGVAVYFQLGQRDRVLACDRWQTVGENLAAIGAHINCIRGIERHCVGTLDQAFAGYDALPAPGADNRAPWRKTFGFDPFEVCTREQVNNRYRVAAKALHDSGLSDGPAMVDLNLARDAAMAELNGSA